MSKWEFIKKHYIDNNIKIIPILPNTKIPAISEWNKSCSSDYMQVLYWYNSNIDMNFAIPCLENNLFVIDLDRHDENKDGLCSFNKLLKDLNCKIDKWEGIDTLIQYTPTGGIHLVFKSDDELAKVKGVSNAFENYPGIDLRNKNYILVEPSVIDGNKYTLANDKTPKPMPDKLKQFIINNANLKTEKNNESYKKPTHVDVGDRDNQLFEYINNLYFKTRLDYDEILLLAEHFNETVFDKPLSEKTVKYKVNKAFTKDRGRCLFIKLSE